MNGHKSRPFKIHSNSKYSWAKDNRWIKVITRYDKLPLIVHRQVSELLNENSDFKWTHQQQTAFDKVKQSVCSDIGMSYSYPKKISEFWEKIRDIDTIKQSYRTWNAVVDSSGTKNTTAKQNENFLHVFGAANIFTFTYMKRHFSLLQTAANYSQCAQTLNKYSPLDLNDVD